ncbi:ribonuclease III [Xenococcus sp. PCC 7305]|uniref:ribonuclease III n=1 Tax=Xenococcus sp. PCC 7305 TaxID=102125 RepID=UPI0002ABD5A4|nr:ribonuclease III [Xenococcus sp. PCC 7305]ELS01383.1 ribonuclease III [Xenococcus sp. PCC 7305]
MFEDPRRQRQLQQLTQKLGLPANAPVDWSLLDLALIHPSASEQRNYEQLEFVGDAVVRLISAEILLETYPEETVGEFAAVRSIVVSDRVLAELAIYYGIEPYLIIGPNAKGNSTGRQSWLADAFEAILGALYLSTHNMDLIRPWLDEALQKQSAKVRSDPARGNYKDALQEWTQGKYKILPKYKVSENTKSATRDKRFVAEVWLPKVGAQEASLLGKGVGRSKKSAEQAAAKAAFYSVVT